ncbi:MAG: nucleoside deaminase [Alphaproteobacteria bacterium]|nr:nucleoside deaminase [Alphaproteobacteria bacterium]
MSIEDYMNMALKLAQKAIEQDEIPVGCLIVDPKTNTIIAATHNLSQHSEDATSHAEILAIREACQKLGQNRLRDMDMYVTLEPCTMCTAAISFARIKNLYFGAFDEKGGAVVNGIKFYEQPTCHHRPNVFGGILEDECSKILKKFFKNKRNKI